MEKTKRDLKLLTQWLVRMIILKQEGVTLKKNVERKQ